MSRYSCVDDFYARKTALGGNFRAFRALSKHESGRTDALALVAVGFAICQCVERAAAEELARAVAALHTEEQLLYKDGTQQLSLVRDTSTGDVWIALAGNWGPLFAETRGERRVLRVVRVLPPRPYHAIDDAAAAGPQAAVAVIENNTHSIGAAAADWNTACTVVVRASGRAGPACNDWCVAGLSDAWTAISVFAAVMRHSRNAAHLASEIEPVALAFAGGGVYGVSHAFAVRDMLGRTALDEPSRCACFFGSSIGALVAVAAAVGMLDNDAGAAALRDIIVRVLVEIRGNMHPYLRVARRLLFGDDMTRLTSAIRAAFGDALVSSIVASAGQRCVVTATAPGAVSGSDSGRMPILWTGRCPIAEAVRTSIAADPLIGGVSGVVDGAFTVTDSGARLAADQLRDIVDSAPQDSPLRRAARRMLAIEFVDPSVVAQEGTPLDPASMSRFQEQTRVANARDAEMRAAVAQLGSPSASIFSLMIAKRSSDIMDTFNVPANVDDLRPTDAAMAPVGLPTVAKRYNAANLATDPVASTRYNAAANLAANPDMFGNK